MTPTANAPVFFISHGAPTFATEPGQLGPLLQQAGQQLTDVAAVLVVSPHWQTRDVEVQTTLSPETIHDFGGFPANLYRLNYPAQGHPALAQATAELLRKAGWHVDLNERRGLDHGAWVPLMHLLPRADVPVFQVSLPLQMDTAQALQMGQALAPLRAQGVAIVGSGSVTHNLHDVQASDAPAVPYAAEFNCAITAAPRHTPCVHTRAKSIFCHCWSPSVPRSQVRQRACLKAVSPTACWRWIRTCGGWAEANHSHRIVFAQIYCDNSSRITRRKSASR